MGKISTTALLKGILGTASTALTLGLLSSSQGMAATMTDVELSLLVDVSGSVNNSEFNLQRNGYADAFRSSSVIDGITNGNEGQIAANLIYWSDSNRQAEAVEWSSIDDAASANDFADAIATAPRPFGGATAPGSAIDFSVPGFDANEFNSTREVSMFLVMVWKIRAWMPPLQEIMRWRQALTRSMDWSSVMTPSSQLLPRRCHGRQRCFRLPGG